MEIPGYQLQQQIGKGGMAVVHLALQESFQRQVAIKIMSSALKTDPDFAKRFQREARIVAQLNHPNIIPVYDVGEYQGHPYMTMEYVGGGHLRQHIKAGMTPKQSLRVLTEIASALDYASEKGFIHRDVKPDNIMFRENGSSVLMDFGIARAMMSDENMTQMGTIVGTPKYMSPEQHRGKSLDFRSDLYSLGVVFFEMLTGKPPFQADDPIAMGMKHASEPIPLLPKPLKRLQPLVRKLLAKDPDKRFQSSDEVAEAIAELRQPPPTGKDDPASDGKGRAAFKHSVQQNNNEIKLEPRLRIQERKEKSGLLSSAYTLDIYLSADDFSVFQKHFQEISNELAEWGPKRGKKCGRIQTKAIIHPWIVGRIKEYFRNLRNSESFSFMQSIPLQIQFTAANGEPLELYTLEPESQES